MCHVWRRRFLWKNKKFHLYAVQEYMVIKWNCGMLTRYGRVNIRKRNNERADNRHEKNWSNNLPKEHNYTNIKKHKNCNLLYITFIFRPNEGSSSVVEWDCVWLKGIQSIHTTEPVILNSFKHKIDLWWFSIENNFFLFSIIIWLICFIRACSFLLISFEFETKKKVWVEI